MFMGVALTGRFSHKRIGQRVGLTLLDPYSGVGGSLYWCFGIVYLDDNMGKANSPFMLR